MYVYRRICNNFFLPEFLGSAQKIENLSFEAAAVYQEMRATYITAERYI